MRLNNEEYRLMSELTASVRLNTLEFKLKSPACVRLNKEEHRMMSELTANVRLNSWSLNLRAC